MELSFCKFTCLIIIIIELNDYAHLIYAQSTATTLDLELSNAFDRLFQEGMSSSYVHGNKN